MSSLTAREANSASSELKVGEWLVDPARHDLSRNGKSIRLEPKVIDVLLYLAGRAGKVVGREELLAAVWPGVVVGDDALTQAIIKLRKALGDESRSPTYIETISKGGYRLIAPVELAGRPTVGGVVPRPPFARRRLALLAVAGSVIAIAIGALLAFPEIAKTFGMPWPIAAEKTGVPSVGRPTIAVLPLANLSGDPKREYFSDGLTEDIINALGRFSGVRVLSRNAVEAFKSKPATLQVIRSDLGARYMVKGSVRQADDRLRVAVELSDTEKSTVLWSERYEGEGREVFDIQDKIVRDIVGRLAVKVTRLEHERAATKPVESLEAFDLVLRARELVRRIDRNANRQARTLLGKAVEVAPNYAEAYIVLAHAEYHRAQHGWTEDPAGAMRRSEMYARRALTIEDAGAHARAHARLSFLYTSFGDSDQALAEGDRAIALNPSDPDAYAARAGALLWLGRMEEAIAAAETARHFDPSSIFRFETAMSYYTLGRYREALAISDTAIAHNPNVAFSHVVRAATLGQMGNLEEASKAAAHVRRLDPFTKVEQYGTRFKNPEHTAKLQEGLRKAGL